MAKRKGPTWDQIHAPGANNIESRDFPGYTRKWSEMGKSRIEVKCPFCKMTITAYLWSVAGGGKRCNCGAMFGSGGTFYHFADRSA